MNEIGQIGKHEDIIVIVQCQQRRKTTMESTYGSECTQRKDGEIGELVDIWRTGSCTTGRNLTNTHVNLHGVTSGGYEYEYEP